MSDNDFRPKAMKKSELAKHFYPDLPAHSATSMLFKKVHANPELMEVLRFRGYSKKQKRLFRSQVETIIDYLGEPD